MPPVTPRAIRDMRATPVPKLQVRASHAARCGAEALDDGVSPRLHHAAFQTLRLHDGAQLPDAASEIVVDDDVLVLLDRSHLLLRHIEPAPDLLLRILAAAPQARLEDLERRRQ